MFRVLFILLICFPMLASSNEPTKHPVGDKIRLLVEKKNIPGFAGAIVREGKLVWSEGFGHVDGTRRIEATPDTPFWIASVTKTFVGLAYLQLAEEKKIDLDERAANTPDFTGLCEWLASTSIPFAKGMQCDQPITIRNILNHQVNGVPGSYFMYNPIMFSRLSRHLEHKNGNNVQQVKGRHNFLAQAIDRIVLNPAKMERTMSSMLDRSKPLVFFDMSPGYRVDEKGYQTKLAAPERYIAGGAGVISTVNDLVKYSQMLDTLKTKNPKIYKQLFTPAKLNSGEDSVYSFGWYIQEYKGVKLAWHSGWDEENGYSSLLLKVPEKNLTFVILANSEAIWWGNPIDKAEVEKSEFAKLFLDAFL